MIAMLEGADDARSPLTEQEYEERRSDLEKTYGANAKEAAAKRAQALAVLFTRSGWTEHKLAAKEGRSQPWVACQLRFGRYISWITGGNKSPHPPPDLTERRFRDAWEQTDKQTGEEFRFFEVQSLLEKDKKPKHKGRATSAETIQNLQAENAQLKRKLHRAEERLKYKRPYLNDLDLEKLGKTLGMMDSGADGEALSAARRAQLMLKKSGWTWFDALGIPNP